jgi:hypothetical protein
MVDADNVDDDCAVLGLKTGSSVSNVSLFIPVVCFVGDSGTGIWIWLLSATKAC